MKRLDVAVVRYALFVLITLFALFVVKVLDISYPFTVVTSTRSSELAVVGEGQIDVTPDTAYVDAGITVSNIQTVEAAQKMLQEVNNKVLDAIEKLGVPKSDIKTSNYSIYPNYRSEGKISGYNGNATINVKLKDITLASLVVTEATKMGANQIQGVRYVVDKPEESRKLARDKAIGNAKKQAQELTSMLGIRLGRITNIVESSPDRTYAPMYAKSAVTDGMGGGAPNFEPGTETITSTVTLYFEKK